MKNLVIYISNYNISPFKGDSRYYNKGEGSWWIRSFVGLNNNHDLMKNFKVMYF